MEAGRLVGTAGGVSVLLFRPHSSAERLGFVSDAELRVELGLVGRAGLDGRLGGREGMGCKAVELFCLVRYFERTGSYLASSASLSSCVFFGGKGGSFEGSNGGALIRPGCASPSDVAVVPLVFVYPDRAEPTDCAEAIVEMDSCESFLETL